jgi:benzoyl-CoA-dihydrodiol lyase
MSTAEEKTIASFETSPDQYKHWKLSFDGDIATLAMDVQEDGGMGDYQLKLNSYDLSVDIELADAIQRLRFEHPEVKTVVLTA